ncbi:hypothetical protein JZ751_007135 [Albula glossodonta]|uniref:Uncharacterized protein n=1 Tax=Albula glossodonta TaxID=121402 RepID=A0A8T2PBA6_9TELE|nr:hypothetical protein JZ751_007135 [Albula glossodonta]
MEALGVEHRMQAHVPSTAVHPGDGAKVPAASIPPMARAPSPSQLGKSWALLMMCPFYGIATMARIQLHTYTCSSAGFMLIHLSTMTFSMGKDEELSWALTVTRLVSLSHNALPPDTTVFDTATYIHRVAVTTAASTGTVRKEHRCQVSDAGVWSYQSHRSQTIHTV